MQFKASAFEGQTIRRLCDVVMKGGITSGVVYPLAICKLATTYVVKNIGGTSVGAIAAAITAAAEYRRRQYGSGQGYVELSKLPQFLGRRGALFALFAPDLTARALFRIALIPIGNASAAVKALRLAVMLLAQYVWIPVLSIAIVFALFAAAAWPMPAGALWRCLGAAIVVGALVAFVGVALRFVYQVVRVLDRNSFGWSHGYSSKAKADIAGSADVTALEAKDVPPLFNWLEAFIGQTAGTPRSEPLTFGDLWRAPHPPWHRPAEDERCIDFRMVTTCLTLGRPFELPFDPTERISELPDPETDVDDDNQSRPPIYFRAEDLEQYFSADVVRQMKKWGALTRLGRPADRSLYYRFPAANKVPIVVATRMSMSFPVLFCAVPLYALDATGTMQPLWFSDGGLSSNFPIHFFDSPLPKWPTFAIDLLPGAPPSQQSLAQYSPGTVVMESQAPPGIVNPWNKLGRGAAGGNVLAFASAILDSVRNWQDVTLGSLPGNASRIVGIRLSADEGGLNLDMPPQTIEAMTKRGLEAGSVLIDLFARGPDAPGWREHRWLRYRAIMGAFTRWVDGYQKGYRSFRELPAQASYEQLIGQELDASDAAAARVPTAQLAGLDINRRFYDLEEKPIAVLPTRPVV